MDSIYTQQHVLVVGDGSLFHESVTSLLTTHGTDLFVSYAIYSDEQDVLNKIKRDQPDVILVSESRELDTARILDLVSSDPVAMGLPIVVARLSANEIDVYERPSLSAGEMSATPERIIARTADDLLNVLRRK